MISGVSSSHFQTKGRLEGEGLFSFPTKTLANRGEALPSTLVQQSSSTHPTCGTQPSAKWRGDKKRRRKSRGRGGLVIKTRFFYYYLGNVGREACRFLHASSCAEELCQRQYTWVREDEQTATQ